MSAGKRFGIYSCQSEACAPVFRAGDLGMVDRSRDLLSQRKQAHFIRYGVVRHSLVWPASSVEE